MYNVRRWVSWCNSSYFPEQRHIGFPCTHFFSNVHYHIVHYFWLLKCLWRLNNTNVVLKCNIFLFKNYLSHCISFFSRKNCTTSTFTLESVLCTCIHSAQEGWKHGTPPACARTGVPGVPFSHNTPPSVSTSKG